VPVEGSEFTVECDTVVMAIGQSVDLGCITDCGVEISRWGTIVADEQTTRTLLPDVFSGGDAVSGPDIAVEAVGAGHRAAMSIDQYLRGTEVIGRPEFWNVSMGALDEVTEQRFANTEKAERAHMSHLAIEERTTTFKEVALGFDPETAVAEAKRCLSCGCAAIDDCHLREYSMEYGVQVNRFGGARKEYALDNSHADLVREPGKCIQCGMCVRICHDLKGFKVFTFVNRGFEAVVEPYFGLPLGETNCDGCLQCVDVCPTGALMSREASFFEFEPSKE
jgi:formate dehydrogenase major subunit